MKGAATLHDSNRVAVNTDLVALTLLLQRLGQHQLSHPVNPLVAGLDGEVMRLVLRTAVQRAGVTSIGLSNALAIWRSEQSHCVRICAGRSTAPSIAFAASAKDCSSNSTSFISFASFSRWFEG